LICPIDSAVISIWKNCFTAGKGEEKREGKNRKIRNARGNGTGTHQQKR